LDTGEHEVVRVGDDRLSGDPKRDLLGEERQGLDEGVSMTGEPMVGDALDD